MYQITLGNGWVYWLFEYAVRPYIVDKRAFGNGAEFLCCVCICLKYLDGARRGWMLAKFVIMGRHCGEYLLY